MKSDDVRAFVAVAETATLSAAAKQLSVSVSTISRRLDALERSLSLALVVRTVDGAFLTEEGERLLARAEASVEAAQAFERAAAAVRQGAGREAVRISATEPMISEILAPAVTVLRQTSPDTILQLVSSNEPARLARREADMALRLVRPTGDSLIARRLPDIELGRFVSNQFRAARSGGIDIETEPLLAFDDSFGEIAEVEWLRSHELESQVVLKSLSSRALINAALAGAGIAVAPRFLARKAGLVEVPAPPIPPRQVWLVLHRDLRHNREMKTIRNWIATTVRAALS